MPSFAVVIALAGLFATSTQAQTSAWIVKPAEAGRGETLNRSLDDTVSYRFECTPEDVIVTETGVTKLLDLKTGKPVEDGPGAVMPAGSAMLAVFGGKGDPQFKPAQAVKNPAGGWDLTIRLPKDDKQLKAVGKSDMMSLFTTGYTIAVVMDAADRLTWTAFMKRCQTTK